MTSIVRALGCVLLVGCSASATHTVRGLDASASDVIAPSDIVAPSDASMDGGMDVFDVPPPPPDVGEFDVPIDYSDVADDLQPPWDAVYLDTTPTPAPTVRLVAPLSGVRVSSSRPTLHWTAMPSVVTATVDLCSDRACAHPIVQLMATGTSLRPSDPLPPGVVFWRVTGLDASGTSVGLSAVWEFAVGRHDAPIDTCEGTLHDFNGDSYDDLAVSNVGPGALPASAVEIFAGSASGLPTTPTNTVFDPYPTNGGDSDFGLNGLVVLDFDGDGLADLFVGDDTFGTDGHVPGMVALYWGSPSGLQSSPAVWSPPPTVDQGTGYAITGGDLNGDGYGDLVIGTRGGPPVDVIYGGPREGVHPIQVLPARGRYGFGFGVGFVGDVDGDGYGDLLVGQNLGDSAGFLYFGGPAGLTPDAYVVLAPMDGAAGEFARWIAGNGDFNGDGLQDFAVGSAGTVSLYLGRADRAITTPWVVLPRGPWDGDGYDYLSFGANLSVGDVDGDGYTDVAVGEPCVLSPLPDGGTMTECRQGAVYLFHGGPSVATVPWRTLVADATVGRGLAVGGDWNGDGFNDLAAGCLLGRAVSTQPVFVFNGAAAGPTPMPSLQLTVPPDEGGFGAALALRKDSVERSLVLRGDGRG